MAIKTKDHYEITPAVIRKCEKLAARGLTIIQIGTSLGWSEETIHKKKREYPELAESIRRGQAKGIETISNALYKRAKGFTYKETHEEARKDEKGKTTQHRKVVKKHAVPDTTAQIFYLKNRDPQHWQDKHDHNIQGDIIIKTDSDDDDL
jgi:hypothetical protein